MTLVILGIDALDPELVKANDHANLTLESYKSIDTIVSDAGSPSTHELWPTIITGLTPEEHGLVLNKGVSWEHPLLSFGSQLGDYILPDFLQAKIGAWLLNNTSQDAFRTSSEYYQENDLTTVFDNRLSLPIGIPNYVVNPNKKDREHQLRQNLGELFERDPNARTGHTSADPVEFYEQCLEMMMIRIARVRRGLRSSRYELVFGYTSGLDLVGHVAHDSHSLQERAYNELDDFVGEIRNDLDGHDDLILLSDHGLQNGLHTEHAMVAATVPEFVEIVDSVLDVRDAIDMTLSTGNYTPENNLRSLDHESDHVVHDHLEDLGYL